MPRQTRSGATPIATIPPTEPLLFKQTKYNALAGLYALFLLEEYH